MPVRYSEPYEEFRIGDDVFCLAWIGMPFRVVGKDDATHTIQIDGQAPCSLKEGCSLDIRPNAMYMLTHKLWDQIWYWPDREGERYREVVDRFVENHREKQVVTGYLNGDRSLGNTCRMAFQLSFDALIPRYEIWARPVAAVSANGEGFIQAHDGVPANAWWPVGPAAPLRIQMSSYRWALTFGDVVLNWQDFGK